MKRVAGLLLTIFVFTVFSQCVLALKPSVEFRPETPTVISKDASFVVIVDPKTTEKPIRITWSVYDTGSEGIGSFPMVDGKGVCYFSNEDGNATCGPSPFTKAGTTEFYVYVITPSKTENTTISMDISDITLANKEITREGNTIYMVFYTPEYDSFTYKVYHEDFSFFTQGVLTRTKYGYYAANKTLNPGIYYFAFFAEENGTYGTDLARIIIPTGDYLTIETSKENYWTGENVRITGSTNAVKVSGRINFPNGSKAMNFETNTKTDGTFSYEFRIPSTWPEGKYNVTTSEPLAKFVTFSAANLIQVTPVRVSEMINKSDNLNKTITLKNLGTNKTNLSVSVSGDLLSSHVSLKDQTLDGGKTTTLTVTIQNIQINLKGTITVKTTLGIELAIPVNIYVEEPEGGCPECPQCPGGAGGLDITPKILSQNCLTETKITQAIVLKNNGPSKLTSFTFDVSDVYSDNSLSDLKSIGELQISLSGVEIESGQSRSVDLEITPYNQGSYRGVIAVKSGGSEAYMLVNLNCFGDMSGEISLLEGELENLGLSSDSTVYNDINYLLGNAQDAYDVGNYPEAKSNLDKAKARIATVNDLGGAVGPPIDMTIPIVVIVVILVVVFLVYFLKFRKGGGKSTPPEEEFEEEF